MVEIQRKSFTRERELEFVEFEVDGEVFEAINVAPAMAVLDVARVNSLEDIEKVTTIMAFLDQVLRPESAERFAARLKSATDPITIQEAAAIAVWLVQEVYATERPTQGPSPSPNGSGTTGPSTTDTASTGGSTQEPSTQRVL